MATRSSTGEKIATPGSPHGQPLPSSSPFFPYLLECLRSEDENYQCEVPHTLDPRETLPNSVEEEHMCINLHKVDIFRHARDFDKGPQSKGRRSTRAVNILASFLLVFVIPVSPVILLVYTVPRLLWDIFHMSTISKEEDFDTRFHPYRWSRLAAIWVVYVPRTKIAGMGGLSAIVLPSLRPAFKHSLRDAVADGHKRRDSRRKAKENLEKLYDRLLNDEFKALHEAANPGELASPNDIQSKIDAFRVKAESSRAVKGYLADVKMELRDIEEIAATEGCMARTGYKGIADWANDAWSAYQNLINAISAVCGLGAGLTYTSIFSANRGNLGYMCWSFSLFVIGLVLSTTTQALLIWCARLQEYPFSTPSLWEAILAIGVYSAVGFVISAVCLLMLSVQQLNYVAETHTDAPLVFSTDPKPPAFLAFSTLGTGVLTAAIVFLLFCGANGVKVLIWRRSLDRLKAPKRDLDDYPQFNVDIGKLEIKLDPSLLV